MVALSPAASVRRIVGHGTPEPEWDVSTVLDTLDPLDIRSCRRAVVLSPHPDDETLGLGGLISTLMAANMPITVVSATDGEASHPGHGPALREALRRRRPAESRAALTRLGGGAPPEIVRLSLPDGELAQAEPILTRLFSSLLSPGDWCFATWEQDGHPDHEAVARSASTACGRLGARLLSYPIWMWHWADPADPQLPWSQARRIPLSPHALRRKRLALECFASQTRPMSQTEPAVLSPNDLAHFLRPFEVVFV